MNKYKQLTNQGTQDEGSQLWKQNGIRWFVSFENLQ